VEGCGLGAIYAFIHDFTGKSRRFTGELAHFLIPFKAFQGLFRGKKRFSGLNLFTPPPPCVFTLSLAVEGCGEDV